MMQVLELASVPLQPWRNGGGVTQELLVWPQARSKTDDWQCRISVARIDQDGPFSAYPDVDRWFTVLTGQGVLLRFAHHRVALDTNTGPLQFDGAAAPACDLQDGPTQDLNLMLRRSGGQGGMATAQAGQAWPCDAPLRAVFTLDATALHVHGQPALALPAGSLAWGEEAAHQIWQLASLATPVRAWWLHFKPNP
jgi:uncharacterized protein